MLTGAALAVLADCCKRTMIVDSRYHLWEGLAQLLTDGFVIVEWTASGVRRGQEYRMGRVTVTPAGREEAERRSAEALKLAKDNLAFEIALAKSERATAKPYKPAALDW